MKKNKLIFLLIFCLVIICLLFIILNSQNKGSFAEVSIDGNVVMKIDLSEKDNETISLVPYGRNMELFIKDGKIRVLSSDCPNKTCVNTGFISKKGQTAVCLPNKTSVTVLGK